jgi:hypothetical protein
MRRLHVAIEGGTTDAPDLSVDLDDHEADRLVELIRHMLDQGDRGSVTVDSPRGAVLVPLRRIRWVRVETLAE